MKLNLLSILALLSVILFSCQKEMSLENSSNPAEGSLQSDVTTECLPKSVAGAYIAGTPLDNSNYIEVQIDVTKEGSYNITTDTINGYFFKGSGNFMATGLTMVKLEGVGTPVVTGNNLFLVEFDSTFCLLQVSVLPAGTGAADFTLMGDPDECMNYSLMGTYAKGQALTASNKVQLTVNVTAIGTYSVTTTAVNGMVFSGNGTLATTGIHTISLTGSGTPINDGVHTVTVNAGTSTCTFEVTVAAGPPPAPGDQFWKFTEGSTTYQGTIDPTDAQLVVSGPVTSFNFFGETITGDTTIQVNISDINGGGINTNETYNSSATTANSGAFLFNEFGSSDYIYEADPTTTTVNTQIKVTGHNPTTKTIQGTFSGTAIFSDGSTKNITAGTFKTQYQ